MNDKEFLGGDRPDGEARLVLDDAVVTDDPLIVTKDALRRVVPTSPNGLVMPILTGAVTTGVIADSKTVTTALWMRDLSRVKKTPAITGM